MCECQMSGVSIEKRDRARMAETLNLVLTHWQLHAYELHAPENRVNQMESLSLITETLLCGKAETYVSLQIYGGFSNEIGA